jgi:hypothetical protein
VSLEEWFCLLESPINKAAGVSLRKILLKDLLRKVIAGRVNGPMRWEFAKEVLPVSLEELLPLLNRLVTKLQESHCEAKWSQTTAQWMESRLSAILCLSIFYNLLSALLYLAIF